MVAFMYSMKIWNRRETFFNQSCERELDIIRWHVIWYVQRLFAGPERLLWLSFLLFSVPPYLARKRSAARFQRSAPPWEGWWVGSLCLHMQTGGERRSVQLQNWMIMLCCSGIVACLYLRLQHNPCPFTSWQDWQHHLPAPKNLFRSENKEYWLSTLIGVVETCSIFQITSVVSARKAR